MSVALPGSDRPEPKELIRSRIIRYQAVAFRFWWIVILMILAGIGVQAWRTERELVSYQSFGRIIFSGRVSVPGGGGNVMSEDAANFFGTQAELIQSAEARRRATERVTKDHPELKPCGVSTALSVIPRTDIFSLSAVGSEPGYVQAYLNALMEEYIAMRGGMLQQNSRDTAEAIGVEAQNLQKTLQTGEQKLLDWQQTHNLVVLQDSKNDAAKSLGSLKGEIEGLEAERSLMDRMSLDQNLERSVAAKAAAESAAANPSGAAKDEALMLRAAATPGGAENASAYLETRQKYLALESRRQQLLVKLKPSHPALVAIDEDISEYRRHLEILEAQNKVLIESQKEALDAQIATKVEQSVKLEKETLALSQLTAEFDSIKSQVDRDKALYERLVSGVQSVNLGANLPQDRISILEPASPPVELVASMRKAVIAGGLAGLVLGCGILFLIGFADDRLMSILEIQSLIPLNIVGLIPSAGAHEAVGTSQRHQSNDDEPMVEAFRNLRSWWLFTAWDGDPPKSVVITSSIPQEGKSTIAANFAVSLAYGGAKTLLVDADLRRGKLHRTFKVPMEPGLGNYLLKHELSFEESCHETEVPNLSIVPRGRISIPSGEVFFGTGIDRFLAAAAERFEYIILDTSPVLAVDDVSMVAPKVDTTLFVIRKATSSARLVRKAISILEDRQVAIAGLICNDIRPASSEFPYYKYGYHPDDEELTGKSS
jgi:capsular exopolysaccharide synthesis family protein